MKGIDISLYQGDIHFSAVKASGVEIVYIKATEGRTVQDKYFAKNYANAKAAGLKVGFYHFFHANSDIQQQLDNFCNVIQGKTPDCKIMIDVEVTDNCSADVISNGVVAFLEGIKARTGFDVVIYTYTSFANSSLTNVLEKYPLWIAQYSNHVDSNRIWGLNYIGWQYTSKGSIPGISGYCDVNEFSQEILLKKEEVFDVKNLVVYGNNVDRRAAEYLADYLQCPTIDGNIYYDYSRIEYVYCVGGQPSLPFTSYAKKVIAGVDRYDTMIQVLKFIGKL